MKPIDDLVMEYKGAQAEAAKMYPWLGEVSRNFGQAMNDPLWVIQFVDTQEQNYGTSPGMAGLLTGLGLGGANPAAQAAGFAENGDLPYGGASADQASGYGTNAPTSGYAQEATQVGSMGNRQWDQENNLPDSIQQNLDMFNGGGGGRPGTVKPSAGGVRPSASQRKAEQAKARGRKAAVGMGVAASPARTAIGGGSNRAGTPVQRPGLRQAVSTQAPTALARQMSVDLDPISLPEGTEMSGRPGQFVTYWAPDENGVSRRQRATIPAADGTPMPLIYNANGRPTIAAVNEQGTPLISPLSRRIMAAGIDGGAFDVMSGDTQFRQGWLHKVWFGDAGEDGVINSGDERAGDDWWGGLYLGVKTVGRVGFTSLETIGRTLDNVAMFAGGNAPEGYGVNDMARDLYTESPMADLVRGSWSLDQTVLEKQVGTGWGLGGDAFQRREDFARQFGTTKGGKVWGLGPVLSAKLFGLDPDSGVGSAVAGAIDFTKVLVTDPSTWVAPEVKVFQLPKALARGAKITAHIPSAAKGARWEMAKDAYAWAATTATGQSTGRLVYVPGSRLASRVMGRDVYWGLRPVERVAEMEVDAGAATAYARRGMEGIQGEGPLDTQPRSRIAEYDDNELAEFGMLRRAITDDRPRVSLPPIGLTRQVGNTPQLLTEDASEWAGTLWLGTQDPAHAARMLDETAPIHTSARNVYTPLDETAAARNRYVAVDDLLSQYGLDRSAPLRPSSKRWQGEQRVITAFVTEKGLGVRRSDLEWAASRRRAGQRNVRVEIAGAARLSDEIEQDALLPDPLAFDGDPEVQALFGEGLDELPPMDAGANGWGSLLRNGTLNPQPDLVRPHAWKVNDDGSLSEDFLPRPLLSTAPRAEGGKQVPWFNMEFDPAGMRAGIDLADDGVDLDVYATGYTDRIEWAPRDAGGQATNGELLRNLRAVYVNRDLVDFLRAEGKWTPDDEVALRAIDDRVRALSARNAAGPTRPQPLDKRIGVGRWQGWEVWRADGVAENTVPPASPLTRAPDGSLILGPGAREVETPAAFVADSLRAEFPPEAFLTGFATDKAVDTLNYMRDNGAYIPATNRTLSGSGQDPMAVNVTVLPTAEDNIFVGVREVSGAGTTRVDPTARAEATVPRTSRNPSHLRGVHASAASLPDVGYVVGDVSGQHAANGGLFRPREVREGVGPSDLGDKAANDLSRRRGNVRVHSDLESALQFQKAALLLSKLSRLHPTWKWPRSMSESGLAGGMGTGNHQVPEQVVEAVAREVEAVFGEQVGTAFRAEAEAAYKTFGREELGYKQLAERDPFAIMVEKPLMDVVYGPGKYDPDDILGLRRWRQADPTRIEVGRVQMAGVKSDGAKVRRYEDQGADLRVYGDVRPDAVIKNTGPVTDDVITREFPSEPYEAVQYKPVPDLPRPEPQVYVKVGERTRDSDLLQPRPGLETEAARAALRQSLDEERARLTAELDAGRGSDLTLEEWSQKANSIRDRLDEIAVERRDTAPGMFWDTSTEAGIQQTLDTIREYQIEEGTLQPGERPKVYHTSLASRSIARDGLIKGSTGGTLGGTVGARGISLTYSENYAQVIMEHLNFYRLLDRVWRSDAPVVEKAQDIARMVAEDFDFVAQGEGTTLAGLMDDFGEPEVAAWLDGNMDLENVDQVREALDAIYHATFQNMTRYDQFGEEVRSTLDLRALIADDGTEGMFYESLFAKNGTSYSSFRAKALTDFDANMMPFEALHLATDPMILAMLDQDVVRMLEPGDIDIVELDLEDVLRDAAKREVAVRPKHGLADRTSVDAERELVYYGELPVPDEWRVRKLGGNVPFTPPEIKYDMAASQYALRRSVGAVEIPAPEARIGGAWDKRGVLRGVQEWERRSEAAGWVREVIQRPRKDATPSRMGPDGRPEFTDDQLVDVVRWTAPTTERTEQTAALADDVLGMGPVTRSAEAGVIEGPVRVVVPKSFDLYMRHGDGQRLVQTLVDDDTLTMARRFNGKVDVTVLGEVVKIKKKYANLMAAPDADIPMLEAQRAKEITDEFTLAASRGLWEGNPKATNWRKGWTPRLLDHMPGDNVVITDPGMATAEVLRWANAMRVDDTTKTRLLERMLDASTPEGRESVLEAVSAAGEAVIVSKQFQYAPREIRGLLNVLNDLPDEAYGDLPAIRRHLINRGFEGGSADTAAEYAAHVHATARNATRMWQKEWDEARTYMRDLVARGDGGEVRGPDGEPVPLPSSLMIAEMIESTVPMPNARDLMRLTSRQGAWFQYAARQAKISGLGPSAWLKTKAGVAYQKVIDNVLERYTQDWFKPMVLLRAAYVLRVIPEEQARMWASGWVNTVTRPIDYWMVTSGKSNRYMLDGRPWDAKASVTDNEPNLYAEAVGQRYRAAQSRERSSQVVKSFERRGAVDFNDPEMKEYGYGYATTLANLHFDPVIRRLAGGWVPSDLAEMPRDLVRTGTDRQKMSWWFQNSETGRRYLRAFIENQRKDPDLTNLWAFTPEGVEGFLDEQFSYLERYTRAMPELRSVVATGKYGKGARPITRSNRWTDIDPDFAQHITGTVRGLDRAGLPDVKYVAKEFQSTQKATMDRLGDAAMNLVVGAPTRVLSRSPVFKTRYSEHITDLIPLASPNARARILESDWYGDLTGQQRRRVDMAMRDAGSDEGALQFQDIDAVAKQRALSDTQGTLYDFSSKTVLSDALRNISPFFTAWSEAITVWARLFASNPRVASRLNQAIQAGQSPNALDFMYDKDERYAGQGFFWNDPATGEMKFTYPFVDFGAPFPLTGNLKNLNMVATLTPGLGPTVTMPASLVLKPNTENDAAYALRGAIGAVNGGIAPSADMGSLLGLGAWTKNFIAAYAPALGGTQTQGMYANAISDARRYLISVDEGMLTDKDFQAKTEQLAQRLLVSRGVGQFFLPTVADHRATALASGRLLPDPQMIEQSVLSDMYRTYNDTYGFNEGNMRFLQDFGRGGFLAAGGVNKYDGYLDYTATQWNFIRKNPELTREYRAIIGLIAPPSEDGEKFNFDAYRYSQEAGMRQPKTSAEYQADVQTRLGKLVLDQAEKSGMDEDGRRALRQYLHQQLPLFTDFSGSAEERAQNTILMYEVAQDERVPSDTREAISTYLGMRDQALLSVGDPAKMYNPDWSAKKRKAAAAALYASGQRLAQTNRGFTRSWEYLFSRELEQALGL